MNQQNEQTKKTIDKSLILTDLVKYFDTATHINTDYELVNIFVYGSLMNPFGRMYDAMKGFRKVGNIDYADRNEIGNWTVGVFKYPKHQLRFFKKNINVKDVEKAKEKGVDESLLRLATIGRGNQSDFVIGIVFTVPIEALQASSYLMKYEECYSDDPFYEPNNYFLTTNLLPLLEVKKTGEEAEYSQGTRVLPAYSTYLFGGTQRNVVFKNNKPVEGFLSYESYKILLGTLQNIEKKGYDIGDYIHKLKAKHTVWN